MEALKENFGPLDLLVYSLASPVRKHPRTGVLHRSVIKPLGEPLRMKSLNVDKGEVGEVELAPAAMRTSPTPWRSWAARIGNSG